MPKQITMNASTPTARRDLPPQQSVNAVNVLSVAAERAAGLILAQLSRLDKLDRLDDEHVKQLTSLSSALVKLHKEQRDNLAAERAAAATMSADEQLELLTSNPAFIERLAADPAFVHRFLGAVERKQLGEGV